MILTTNMSTTNLSLQLLAQDLSKEYPRSPRALLGGFVLAARALDKCRAMVAGTGGEYHFDCPLDRMFFDFAKIDSAAFRSKVEAGATDADMDAWVRAHSAVKSPEDVIVWNNKLRFTRICDLPVELQVYMEEYIPRCVPRNRPVYVFFDVYDLEEERI